MVLIEVNAPTDPEPAMNTTNRQPSAAETINAMSDVQLHRHNADTIELTKLSFQGWAKTLSSADRPIALYFVRLSFRDVAPERRGFFNQIPTTFALSDEQVDALVAAGAELLHANAEFRRFITDVRR